MFSFAALQSFNFSTFCMINTSLKKTIWRLTWTELHRCSRNIFQTINSIAFWCNSMKLKEIHFRKYWRAGVCAWISIWSQWNLYYALAGQFDFEESQSFTQMNLQGFAGSFLWAPCMVPKISIWHQKYEAATKSCQQISRNENAT